MPADDCLRLEVAPLPLPWQAHDDGAGFVAELGEGYDLLIEARIFRADLRLVEAGGFVRVSAGHGPSAFRHIPRGAVDEMQRQCEAFAGLLLAALGLPRPGEKS